MIISNNYIKRGTFNGFLFFVLLFGLSCSYSSNNSKKTISQGEVSQFTVEVRDYYLEVLDSLNSHIQKMDTVKSIEENKAIFSHVRKWYKYAEPLIIAFDYTNYLTLNGPNLPIIHAEDYTEIKKLKPRSFQVVEELLYFEEEYDAYEMYLQLTFLKSRIPFIAHNHIIQSQRDRHFLKMIRDEIVTVATKGITGFDSPGRLKSMEESAYVYESIHNILKIFEEGFNDKQLFKSWVDEVKATQEFLKASEFDDFDRYSFIKKHTNRQLSLVKQTADDWKISLSTSRALNPISENLFDPSFFNIELFTPRGTPPISEARIKLGRALFNDQNLSSDGTMSCGTCHLKNLAFTDGKTKAVGNDGKPLQRNTPTLTYAAYQKKFFLDGTSSTLETQILGVVNNVKEFHTNMKDLEKEVATNETYKIAFDSLYGGKMDGSTIRNSIATYIRSLAPFNSNFDMDMQGKKEILTKEEIKGFNLFMGKAACATCHFPPAFNGTVPPKYDETEFEHLGLPANASFTKPKLDDDPGAFYPYEVEERRGFFKTPTVRNSEMTAPYMHNGVYNTLEEVVKFYNFGGGTGMGLEVPYQTLPPDSLNLTDTEQNAIIAFMKSLTDQKENKSDEL